MSTFRVGSIARILFNLTLRPKANLNVIELSARFGEELHCFFADKNGLFLWFYGPIAVMLGLNLAGCAAIVKTLYSMRKQKRKLGIDDDRNQGGNLR